MNLEGKNADARAQVDGRETALRGAMKVESASSIVLDGVPGRYLIGVSQSGGRAISEIFFTGDHLYEVVAQTSAAASSQDIVDEKRFSDSFHFGS